MSASHKDVQIHVPELLSAPERTRDTVLTAVMWGVYLYLWLPLISMFAWLLGFEFAYDVMIRTGGAAGLGGVLLSYAVAVAAIFGVVSLWSMGNKLRYGKLRRRHTGSDVTIVPMAEYFGVEVAAAARLRSLRSVVIDFDEDGHPVIERHRPQVPRPDYDGAGWDGTAPAKKHA
jgi:biofilm PGA synthesis protein PgaD